MITSITPPFDLIDELMSKLISILQDSTVRFPSGMAQADYLPVLAYQDELYAGIEPGLLPQSIPSLGILQSAVSRCKLLDSVDAFQLTYFRSYRNA